MTSRKTDSPVVAYFSMEIAVTPSVPSYAGGLGVFAVIIGIVGVIVLM